MAQTLIASFCQLRQPRMAALLSLLVLIAIAGGTSRADSFAQVFVRAGAFVALIGWTFVPGPQHASGVRWPLCFLLAAIAIVAVQLIPLPPLVWTAASGRAFYTGAATAADLPQPWRPLNLNPDRGLSALFSLSVPAAVLLGISRLSSRDRPTLGAVIAAIAAVSAILGLAQLSAGNDSGLRWYAYTNAQSAVGLLANRNHQALLLACAMPFSAAWATASMRLDRPWSRGWIALGLGGFLILMLPTTGSRAGLVTGAIGAISGLAIALPAIRARLSQMRTKRRHKLFMAGGLAVLAFLTLLVFFGRNEAVTRLRDLDSGGDLRLRSLPIVWRMVGEFFPFGSGFGSFEVVYRRFERFDLLSTEYLNQAHNDVIQLILEGGAIAGAAGLIFVGWWIWASTRVWRMVSASRVLAARAGSSVILMCLMASVVDYPLRTPLLLAVFTVAACLLSTAITASDLAESGEAARDDALRLRPS